MKKYFNEGIIEMNILWITLESILPANSGGRLGVFKRLEQVAKTENVYLFYPYDSEEELKYKEDLKEYCMEVHPYYRKKNKWNAIKKIWKYPYTVASRNIPEMEKDIKKCLNDNNIDIINIDFPHMCSVMLNIKTKVPIILNEHNIEWKVYRTISKSQKNIIKKIAYYIDSYRLKRYEQKVLNCLDIKKLTFVSDKDMKSMVAMNQCNQQKACLIPVGADIHQNRNEKIVSKETTNIIFVGKMSYGPNIEAVEWFVDNVFPTIKNKHYDLRFYIVGKDPIDKIKQLATNDIIVTGQVESVDEYYDMADLVVLPLLNGGGVKVKLLEAIGFNKAVVSTSVGVEGTIYSDGESIPVTDDSLQFAELCLKVLSSEEYRENIMKKSYDIFLKNYTWKSVGERYIRLLKEVSNK